MSYLLIIYITLLTGGTMNLQTLTFDTMSECQVQADAVRSLTDPYTQFKAICVPLNLDLNPNI